MLQSIPEETELAPGPLRFSILAAFRYREYRLYWIGGAFSNIGMWALIFGRLWLMHSLTESALYLGLVTTSSLGPILLFSVWGGVLADRVNRLKLVLATRALFAALALLNGALISTDVIRPWQVIVLSLLTGILLSFDIPSRQAMLPRLVPRERLVNAIALYSMLFSASSIVGPGFFAPLVNLWGLDGLFYLIGGSYLLTVALMSLMKPSLHQSSSDQHQMWLGLLEGFRYIRRSRLILSLIGIATVGGIFGMSFETLLPIFAEELLQGGVDTYSIMLLGLGVGGISGTVALAWFGSLKNSPRFLLLSGIGFGLALALFAQMTWFPAALVTLGLAGGFSVVFMTVNNTMVQSLVAEDFRGRVMSVHQLSWGATALGGMLIGFMAQLAGAPFALTLGGLITALFAGGLVLARLGELARASQAATLELSAGPAEFGPDGPL